MYDSERCGLYWLALEFCCVPFEWLLCLQIYLYTLCAVLVSPLDLCIENSPSIDCEHRYGAVFTGHRIRA